ncbi:helix-turn-helix domain-containing protein, partial [Pseudomonas aeruginosa]|nr:helix-turn-helix domain-containing protein [Pseudomonas aeruginosa]
MTESSLGERLRAERERLGYTQPEFAEIVGASKRTQIGWEQGRTAPDALALAAWANEGLNV